MNNLFMKTIVVSVSDLYQRAKEMLNCGMDFVEVSIIEDPLEEPPVFMYFEAWKASAPDVGYKFEVIDEAERIKDGE